MKIHNLKSILSVIITGLSVCGTTNAAVLSPESALDRALNDSQTPLKIRSNRTSSSFRLVYTANDISNQPALYLFAEDSGFALVSADDNAPALLGYGTGGDISAFESNKSFMNWIDDYGRQIEWLRTNQSESQPRRASKIYPPIDPLVNTKWSQGEPYNDLCPTYQGENCVTGCLATAMAQLMKYYNWPVKGKGSNSYHADFINRDLSMNFEDIKFDWSYMTDTYSSSSSRAEKNAVATLMYAAGVASDMDYNPEGSGASIIDSSIAMVNNFSYYKGLACLMRDYYTADEWQDIVYDQLSNANPVLYTGQSEEGGHAFICDGYSGDGFFHINWGWAGLADGFFLLNALDPESQGIGGTNSGYNFGQYIMAHAIPDNGSAPKDIYPYFIAMDFCVSSSETKPIKRSSIKLGEYAFVHGGTFNVVMSDINVRLGVKAVNAKGEAFYLTYDDYEILEPYYGYDMYVIYIPTDLPRGKYAVSPAVQIKGKEWYDIPVSRLSSRTRSLSVSERSAMFTYDNPDLSGIDDLQGDNPEVISTEIYTLEGIKVPEANPAPGTYVIRSVMSDGSVRTQKFYQPSF